MYNSQLVYDRIDEMVKKRKKSMDELNAECNFSKNTVSSSAKSQDGMKARRLLAIAEFLDCSLDYLLGRIDNPEAHKPQNSYVVNNKDTVVNGTQANIINSGAVERDVLELVELIQSLPIVKRAEAILAIEEIKNNN